KAGLPAVRFTEPLEDYNHQHQTPRTENGIEYGDFEKYLNFTFMGDVARDNAEALRQLAMAPEPPSKARLTGAVTPDAKVSWSADEDRKSTRLNSSHGSISYAVFCLKKKKNKSVNKPMANESVITQRIHGSGTTEDAINVAVKLQS